MRGELLSSLSENISCFPLHFFRALLLPACFTTEHSRGFFICLTATPNFEYKLSLKEFFICFLFHLSPCHNSISDHALVAYKTLKFEHAS